MISAPKISLFNSGIENVMAQVPTFSPFSIHLQDFDTHEFFYQKLLLVPRRIYKNILYKLSKFEISPLGIGECGESIRQDIQITNHDFFGIC